jgi:hypothetical protein
VTAQIAVTPDADTGGALIGRRRRNFVFLAIMLGMLFAALDQTIVAKPLSAGVRDSPDHRHRRAVGDTVRSPGAHLGSSGPPWLRATQHRPAVAHPARTSSGRLRHHADPGMDGRQAHPLDQLPGPPSGWRKPVGPRQPERPRSEERARTHQAVNDRVENVERAGVERPDHVADRIHTAHRRGTCRVR